VTHSAPDAFVEYSDEPEMELPQQKRGHRATALLRSLRFAKVLMASLGISQPLCGVDHKTSAGAKDAR
jgi:hypothetical protein